MSVFMTFSSGRENLFIRYVIIVFKTIGFIIFFELDESPENSSLSLFLYMESNSKFGKSGTEAIDRLLASVVGILRFFDWVFINGCQGREDY